MTGRFDQLASGPTARDIAGLERAVGSRPAGSHLKSITFLDEHAHALLARSTFTIVGTIGIDGSPIARGVGGPPGTWSSSSRSALLLPGLDVDGLIDGAPVGVVSLVPGLGETLRVNGVLRLDPPCIDVGEVFLHCAKCVIRSKLWGSAPAPTPVAETATAATLDDPHLVDFLRRSPFVALFSVDDDGNADVSPKGDPAGFIDVLDGRTIAIPDRPGNRRTDTLHNLMSRDDLAILALVPGEDRSVELRGRAIVSTESALLASMTVGGNAPSAAIVMDVHAAWLRHDPAITASSLWDPQLHVPRAELPRASRIWTDHVKLNDDRGRSAAVGRRLVNERTLAKAVEYDYRKNLY